MIAVAVITGGTSGIGMAIARRLRSDGCRIVLVGRRSASEALDALAAAGEASEGLQYVSADLGDHDETARLVDTLRPLRPRILVHAAGQYAGTLTDDPREARSTLARLCDLHAGAALQLALGLAPSMPAPAHILLLSSTATRRVEPSQAAYAASKGALEVLTRHLAVALGPHVRVNALAPGLVRTSMSEPVFSDPSLAGRVVERTPLGRLASPEDIAAAAFQLVRAEPSWITGEVITVDGGNHIPW